MALRSFPGFRRGTYDNLLESRILSPLNFVNRELAVFFHHNDVPFDWLIIVCVDDVLVIPSDLMKITSEAGVVPANKEVQTLRRVTLHQEVVASYRPLRGKHVTPSQAPR